MMYWRLHDKRSWNSSHGYLYPYCRSGPSRKDPTQCHVWDVITNVSDWVAALLYFAIPDITTDKNNLHPPPLWSRRWTCRIIGRVLLSSRRMERSVLNTEEPKKRSQKNYFPYRCLIHTMRGHGGVQTNLGVQSVSLSVFDSFNEGLALCVLTLIILLRRSTTPVWGSEKPPLSPNPFFLQ